MVENQKIIFSLIFLLSLAAGLMATYFVRAVARRFKIGEMPDPRKVHKTFMPHMGGLGIYAGFLVGVFSAAWLLPEIYAELIQQFGGILLASVVIVALGVYDDLKGLSAGKKFFGQFLSATLIILSGCVIERISLPFAMDIELGWLAVPITYLWLIGVSNAVNLLDGLDGLAGGISAIASAVFAALAYLNGNFAFFIVNLALIGGILGFLKFNRHPATIFMGDTGSLFLGLILAAISIRGFETTPGRIGLLVPMLALAIPIGDTSVAFFRRLNKGKHPFKPDKDHLHHRLVYLGLSHAHAVYMIYLTGAAFGITAFLLAQHYFLTGGIALALVTGLAAFGLKRLGFLEAERTKTYYGDRLIFEAQPMPGPLSVTRLIHKFLLLCVDIFTVNAALFMTWWFRFRSGWMPYESAPSASLVFEPTVMIIFTLGWVALFYMNNLYNLRWDVSRFDHLRRVFRTILFGVIILFVLTFNPAEPFSEGRLSLLIYGGFLLLLVSAGRLTVINLEKRLKILEYAPHRTLLIGNSTKARRLLKDIRQNPHLLYDVRGYVTREAQDKHFAGLPFLGTYDQLPEIIRREGIEEVIIAINERSRDEILNLVSRIDSPSVIFKVLPQMYDAISGLRTEEVIGHPLIRLFPEAMRPWQWMVKRLLDITLSLFLMIALAPLFLLIVLLQLLSGIHPPFEVQNVVGKHGRIFGMLNFATVNRQTGKQPLIGRLLYNSRIYKLPALINILLGKMSFVGPRPETVEVVKHLRQKIKFYNRRFQVRPGLTGWAQVKYRYEEALKYKRDQLKQDLFYLENMSLSFDLRILMRSFLIFMGRKGAR
ncbi:sugar transferase [Calditrichota bacterium GD2]